MQRFPKKASFAKLDLQGTTTHWYKNYISKWLLWQMRDPNNRTRMLVR